MQKGRDTLPSGIGMIGLITCWIGVHGVVGIRFMMNEPEEMRDKRPGIWYHGQAYQRSGGGIPMLKKLYNHLFCQPHMARRIPVLLISVIVMGMCVAFFEKLAVGTDPWTVLNLSIVENVLHWNGLGTWQLILNLFLLGVVLLLRGGRFIGLGSLANMVMVGYSRDFFKPIVENLLPGDSHSLLVRGGVFVPVMAVFLLSVAFYIVVELGTAPYDAIPQIVAAKFSKIPPFAIRIGYDTMSTVIGLILGGKIGVFTVAVCLFLGPVISAIAKKFRTWFN